MNYLLHQLIKKAEGDAHINRKGKMRMEVQFVMMIKNLHDSVLYYTLKYILLQFYYFNGVHTKTLLEIHICAAVIFTLIYKAQHTSNEMNLVE
ncbi:hypothetical protein T11_284 [Trichinella zimbabwensis]|uniref:Uncharacterized protein n=1 Tax=Trichinella zimbabwensis TaxID=268475 RepID=A0A0V1HCQ8_9BILA|nr:hypothetical protein T11_284 [Trichinella zimbabwensis]